MSNDLLKERDERAVFFDFVRCARLDVGTVESRDPPEPDIAFECKGAGFVAMELKSLVDQTLRHRTMRQLERHPDEAVLIWHGSVRNEEGTLEGGVIGKLDEIIENCHKYESEYPIELLLYTEGWHGALPPEDQVIPEIRDRFSNKNHCFRRVWFLDRTRKACKCLYSSSVVDV